MRTKNSSECVHWGFGIREPRVFFTTRVPFATIGVSLIEHLKEWRLKVLLDCHLLYAYFINTIYVHIIVKFIWKYISNVYLSLCRPSHRDPVHRASLCPWGREGYLYLPGHCQPSYHGLQVWMGFLKICVYRFLFTSGYEKLFDARPAVQIRCLKPIFFLSSVWVRSYPLPAVAPE